MKMGKLAMTALGLGAIVLTGSARAQQAAPAGRAAAPPAQAGNDERHKPGDLPGPIDSLSDLEDAGKMLFKMADTNNDGQISQKEAVDAGNLLVGGFFFRADTNGDGTVSQDEAKHAREELLRQKPLLRFLVERGKTAAKETGDNTNKQNPLQGLANLIDANNDKQIQATEVRQAVQSTVQGIFASADTNRDNELSPTEINAAMIGMARTAAQAAFAQADADNNGSLSKEEYDKAIIGPANAIFVMLDANNDGQLTPQEIQSAERLIASQLRMLRVPEAPNSARNLIRSGARPDQVAPVPTFTAPRPGGNAPRR